MNSGKGNCGLAAVFSFLFNGLGQIYNGQIFKGLLIIFFSFMSMLVLILSSILIGFFLLGKTISLKVLIFGCILFFVSLVAIAVLGVYSILDAYRVASEK